MPLTPRVPRSDGSREYGRDARDTANQREVVLEDLRRARVDKRADDAVLVGASTDDMRCS